MIDAATFGIFLSAAFALAITPGPGTFYVMTRSIKGGKTEGVASALGTAVGSLFHVVAAALGVSAILAASAVALSFVKYLGAAYLVYLGVKTILSRDESLVVDDIERTIDYRKNFLQGVTVGVLNPKVALFFLAFIPQFINPEGIVFLQFLLLGTITVALNTVAKFVVVAVAEPFNRKLKASPRLQARQRFATGTGLVTLGTYVAFAGEGES